MIFVWGFDGSSLEWMLGISWFLSDLYGFYLGIECCGCLDLSR